MEKNSWRLRIKNKEIYTNNKLKTKKLEISPKKDNNTQDIKLPEDKLNLAPKYIKPSKDISDIIPFCNNIYTIHRNDT